jgi:hypothetical protein
VRRLEDGTLFSVPEQLPTVAALADRSGAALGDAG